MVSAGAGYGSSGAAVDGHNLSTQAQAVEVVGPCLHHGLALLDVLGAVVGPSQGVRHRVGELGFHNLGGHVQAFGQQTTIPFTLSGDRSQVGRVDVRFEAELVPASPDEVEQTFAPPVGPFDNAAAARALAAVSVLHCFPNRGGGMGGRGFATVIFGTSGTAQSVSVSSDSALTSSENACIASAYRRATVPAFSGGPVTVRKSFNVPADL